MYIFLHVLSWCIIKHNFFLQFSCQICVHLNVCCLHQIRFSYFQECMENIRKAYIFHVCHMENVCIKTLLQGQLHRRAISNRTLFLSYRILFLNYRSSSAIGHCFSFIEVPQVQDIVSHVQNIVSHCIEQFFMCKKLFLMYRILVFMY